MKRENNELRRGLNATTQILSALRSGHEVSSILQALQDHEDPTAIVQSSLNSMSSAQVKRSSSMDACSTTMSNISNHGSAYSNPPPAFESPSTPVSAMALDSNVSTPDSPRRSPFAKSASRTVDASSQTALSPLTPILSTPKTVCELRSKACQGPTDLSDHRMIKQLFSIYWVWVHPYHKILDMDQFVMGYETGNETHCSLFLVYAVCLAACKFLDPSWELVEGKSTDVAMLRRNLLAEARTLKSAIRPNHQTKADIQASAILSLTAADSAES